MRRYIASGLLLFGGVAAPRAATAQGLLISGGLSSAALSPVGELLAPSWRMGLGFGSSSFWLSVPYIAIDAQEGDTSIASWYAQPRIGAWFRRETLDTNGCTPFIATSVYTRLAGYEEEWRSHDDEWHRNSLDDVDVSRFLGASIGAGLEARLSRALTFSAEAGLDGYSLKAGVDGDFLELGSFSIYATGYLNIWL